MAHLCAHFGVLLLPPPTPHHPPPPELEIELELGDEQILIAIANMVIQIVRETLNT